ncbi:MAG TPA: hypothetical protein VF549_21200 [Solirubrobacteraceae bacterium]|jgi:hypothetical protein
MRTHGWGAPRRLGIGIGAAVLLALLVAAVAVTAPDGTAHRVSASSKHDASKLSDEPQLREAAARDRRRLERMRRHLASPAARRARLRSRTTYRAATAPEAFAAAARTFPEVLGEPLWQGPKLATGDRIDHYLGDFSAVVDQRGGPNLFVESMTPLRAGAAGGRKRPIDVRLHRRGDRLAPRNTLAPSSVGVDLADGIRLEKSGIALTPPAGPDTAAPRVLGDKAFFARTERDTDFLVAALPDGVEAFWQLRSPRSPERLALRVQLPRGAELRLTAGGGTPTAAPGRPPTDPAAQPEPKQGKAPGAEIVRDGKRLASILPPSAVDAQGRAVATSLEVHGTTLVVRVPHRAADHAYPVLVDPIVREEWYWRDYCSNGDFSGWRPNKVWDTAQWNFYSGCSFWGAGLYVWTNDRAWTNYQHDEWGEWQWQAYPNTAVVRADLGQINHIPRAIQFGEPSYSSTCTRIYIWSWERGAQGYHSECGALSGHWDTACTGDPPCAHNNTVYGNIAVFNYQILLSGWRYDPGWAFLGAAILTLHDWNVPRVTGLSPAPSTAWVHDTSHAFRVNAHDDGLGVKEVLFDGPGIWDWRSHGCAGNRGSRCPYDWTTDGNAFTYNTASWPEGVHQLRARVWDVVGNPGDSAGNKNWDHPDNRLTWNVRVDRSRPDWLSFTGALSARDRWFKEGSYPLGVSARDTLSGTQYAELQVDGARVDTAESRTCDANGCPQDLTRTFTWNTAGYAEGGHTIRPYARDPLSHVRNDDAWQAKVDRSLPRLQSVSGRFANEGDWVSPGQHDLAVDARDTYSGVKRVELWVDNKLEDAENATCTPSQCPTTFPATLTWDTAGDADGPHAMKLVVIDQLDQPFTRTWSARKDSIHPLALVTGELWDNQGQLVREPSTLEVEGFDEDGANPASGVKSIEVRIDDVRAYFDSQTCTTQPCSMFREWTFDPATVLDGEHTAEVIVTDTAGGEHAEETGFTSERVVARPAETVDLATATAARASGAAAGDAAGTAVVHVGDLNGDDLDDYAIGAPGGDGTHGIDSGVVHVVLGDGTTSPLDLAAAGARGYRILGATARDRAGEAVANAGDVNGDGLEDLLIGAPQTGDALGVLAVQGHVYVVFGSATIGDVDLAALGTRGFRIDGPLLARTPLSATYDGRPRDFGTWLGGAESGLLAAGADVNGDELDDVVIGSPSESRNGRAQSGSTYVVFGKADGTPVDSNALGAGGFRIDGAGAGELSGYAAVPLGDTNDDGLGDVGLTAPGAHASGRTNAGTAYVVFGKPNTVAVDLAALGAQGYPIRGSSGDRLGSSVASLGDLDGDTRQDLAVGGHGVLTVLGKDDTAAVDPAAGTWSEGYQRVTAPAGAEYDHALVVGGSAVDDDVLPDLLVGFPDAAGTRGELYVVYGRSAGAAPLALAGLPGHQGRRIVGAAAGDRAGESADSVDFATLAAPGVLVGSPGSTSSARDGSGSVTMVPAASSGTATPSQAKVPSPRQYDRVKGKRKCYPYRFPPYQHEGPRHVPGCRTTLRRRTLKGDMLPRNSNSRRTPRKPFPATTRIPIVDSEEQVFAYMQQTGPTQYEVFDAAGTSVGVDANTKIDVVGRGCMKTRALSKRYTLMRLLSHDYGFTGFMARSYLPAKALVGVNRKSDRHIRDRGGDGLDNDDIIDHYYAPCGNNQALKGMKAIANSKIGSQAFAERADLYQGVSVGTRTNTGGRCDTIYNPDCGGEYDNYFSPTNWPADVDDPASSDPAVRKQIVQPHTIHLATATTGVAGGGLVNAVLRAGWSVSFRDRIEYTDPNVPCTRRYIAQWWFGRVAQGWEQPTWGWIPIVRPRPAVANTDAKYEGEQRRYSGQLFADPNEPAYDPANPKSCPPQP